MPEQALTAHSMETGSQVPRPAETTGIFGFLKVLFSRTMADKVPVLAAALSFFMMLSVVPVLLLALAILGFVMHEMGYDLQHAAQMAVSQIQQGISKVLPGAGVQQTFRDLAEQINLQRSLINIIEARGIAMVTGVLSLIWAALQIFVNASGLMNLAFDVEETRSWVKLRLVALFVTVGALLLFLLSLLPTSGPDFVRNLNIPWLGLPDPTPFWVDAIFTLLALAINMAMFTFIYRFLPNTRVSWRDAAVGGIAMGVLWEVAKKGFTLFLAGSDNPMYGALGGVILLITWMYYTNILLLLGAEVSGLYRRVRVGSLMPSTVEAHRRELEAVHTGSAVPLAASPVPAEGSLPESKERMRKAMERIKGDVRDMGETVREAAHNVKSTPARHSASRAFETEPFPEERRGIHIAPTPEERRPPRKAPRQVAGALGGETLDSEAEERDRERRAIEERAAREMRDGDYPPAETSKVRAKETVDEIRAHVQSIGRSVKHAREDAPPTPRP